MKPETTTEITGCISIGTYKLMRAPNGQLHIEDKSSGYVEVCPAELFEEAIHNFLVDKI